MENGTHGRKWHTTEKNNIAFSFTLTPNCNIAKLEGLTTKIAEILVDTFEKLYNIKLQIKQPNDIGYKGKKIGGILTETKLNGENVKYLVIGIGINTNQEKFDYEIVDIASSIKNEFNIDIDNNAIISEFCKRFEKGVEL